MTTAELLHVLHTHDIRLTLDGDRLVYDAAAGVLTEEVLTLLRQHKQALLGILTVTAPPSAAAPLDPDYPCVVCSGTQRWNDGGVWRCVACWPPPVVVEDVEV